MYLAPCDTTHGGDVDVNVDVDDDDPNASMSVVTAPDESSTRRSRPVKRGN